MDLSVTAVDLVREAELAVGLVCEARLASAADCGENSSATESVPARKAVAMSVVTNRDRKSRLMLRNRRAEPYSPSLSSRITTERNVLHHIV